MSKLKNTKIMRLQVGTCTERLLHDHKPLLETVRMQACWLAHYGNMEDVIRWGHVTRDTLQLTRDTLQRPPAPAGHEAGEPD